ncbi:MAG: signal recognition particle-docking protein FtsY [Puniceicoccales bacterium]|jgi:fused signal recognition particle receptor|nr:signal recognition particle-docking protein FtsY [Puniceicoccales bacterium]
MVFKIFKKTAKKISKGFINFAESIFPRRFISPADLDTIEMALYRADFGRETTEEILEAMRVAHRSNDELRRQEAISLVKHVLREQLQGCEGTLTLSNWPEVICVIGSNGSGKTTTVAKLAHRWEQMGHSVLLGACDTFRAAANEQIDAWASRLNAEMIGSFRGGDGSAVAYDAVTAAIARKKEVVILDTAGRLHTQVQLLAELKKMRRIIGKKVDESQIHVLLVIDGNNGVNSIELARAFHREVPVDGIIITKLDGASRGGALVAIYRQLKIPIHYLGMGECAEDLILFSLEDYLEALFR